jgi:glycosyltransferase involved in cell wall biosynthesis
MALSDSAVRVSVAIITYNHEKFIAKALDSVLMQETNFDYEIVIGEDCSSDDTRRIIIEYQERYPDKIRLFLNERNVGMHRNSSQVLDACKGEYIASLEGDDYWTSAQKLQKQVDFLDNHPECSACFHDALIVHEDGSNEPTHYRPSQKAFNTVEDLLMDNFIPTCSVMYRRGLFDRLPDWVGALKMGDWPFHIFNALQGKVAYIDETMAVYVIHRGGVWSMKGLEENEAAVNELYEVLAKHLEPKHARIVNRILRRRYFLISKRHEEMNNLSHARAYAAKSLTRHLIVMGELFRPGTWSNEWNPDVLASPYVSTIRNEELLKSLLRLYVVPALRSRIPLICRFLGSAARLLKIEL